MAFYKRHSARFGIPDLPQTLDFGQNSDTGISDFQIFGQSSVNENYHNSRTSHGIDMKVGPVTKLDKRRTATSRKWAMTSCKQIVMSLSFF